MVLYMGLQYARAYISISVGSYQVDATLLLVLAVFRANCIVIMRICSGIMLHVHHRGKTLGNQIVMNGTWKRHVVTGCFNFDQGRCYPPLCLSTKYIAINIVACIGVHRPFCMMVSREFESGTCRWLLHQLQCLVLY